MFDIIAHDALEIYMFDKIVHIEFIIYVTWYNKAKAYCIAYAREHRFKWV